MTIFHKSQILYLFQETYLFIILLNLLISLVKIIFSSGFIPINKIKTIVTMIEIKHVIRKNHPFKYLLMRKHINALINEILKHANTTFLT